MIADVCRFGELSAFFYFTGTVIGTYVLQVTICQASFVQLVITYITLRKRGVANLVEHLILTRHVTMRMCRRSLTGINKAGRRAQKLIILSLVFIDPRAVY